ncbi:hypothetical protein CLOP_g3458 [Closterium sp. NIES-67]|nr:hypothetical protein CLOP_g3458 [Closterium sp. NIES-67]
MMGQEEGSEQRARRVVVLALFVHLMNLGQQSNQQDGGFSFLEECESWDGVGWQDRNAMHCDATSPNRMRAA